MALLLAAALGGEAAVTTAAAYEAAAAGKGRKPFVSPAAGWSPGGWHDIMTKDLAHPNDRGHRWAAQDGCTQDFCFKEPVTGCWHGWW